MGATGPRTAFDNLLAPWNAHAFARVMGGYTRRSLAVAFWAGLFMLCGGIATMGVVGSMCAQRVYLANYGTHVQAAVDEVTNDTYWRPSQRPGARLAYTFETNSGERISDAFRGFASDFARLKSSGRIDVLYAEKYPQVHLAQIEFKSLGILVFISLMLLAFNVHVAMYLRRLRAWRQTQA
jgi:hypothetical protein